MPVLFSQFLFLLFCFSHVTSGVGAHFFCFFSVAFIYIVLHNKTDSKKDENKKRQQSIELVCFCFRFFFYAILGLFALCFDKSLLFDIMQYHTRVHRTEYCTTLKNNIITQIKIVRKSFMMFFWDMRLRPIDNCLGQTGACCCRMFVFTYIVYLLSFRFCACIHRPLRFARTRAAYTPFHAHLFTNNSTKNKQKNKNIVVYGWAGIPSLFRLRLGVCYPSYTTNQVYECQTSCVSRRKGHHFVLPNRKTRLNSNRGTRKFGAKFVSEFRIVISLYNRIASTGFQKISYFLLPRRRTV